MSWLLASGGQSIGASALASALPMNIQGWFPLELTGLISLKSKGLSRVFSTTIQKHQFFGTKSSLWSNSWFLRRLDIFLVTRYLCLYQWYTDFVFLLHLSVLGIRVVLASQNKLGSVASISAFWKSVWMSFKCLEEFTGFFVGNFVITNLISCQKPIQKFYVFLNLFV